MVSKMKKILLSIILSIFSCSFLSSREPEEEKHPVVILGGGMGALTSATYLARAGITPLVITGPVLGGLSLCQTMFRIGRERSRFLEMR